MLMLTIDGDKASSYVYYDVKKKKYKGFSASDNSFRRISKKDLEVLNFLKLSSNYSNVKEEDGYQVVIDNESGLYHFFKDGKEDIERLYVYNSENVTMYSLGSKIDKFNKLARKLMVKGIALTFTGILGFNLVYNAVNSDQEVLEVDDQDVKEVISVVEEKTLDDIVDNIDFVFSNSKFVVKDINEEKNDVERMDYVRKEVPVQEISQEEIVLDDNVVIEESIEVVDIIQEEQVQEDVMLGDPNKVVVGDVLNESVKIDFGLQDAKSLIYSSENLNDYEKDLLWNEDLIKSALEANTSFKYRSLLASRLYNINILPFPAEYVGSDALGFYIDDNNIYVRGYDSEDKEKIESLRGVIAHEFIHLLQPDYQQKFIIESCAELMSQEYYLNNASTSRVYSYSTGCDYTKVLMETFGVDAIRKGCFGDYSEFNQIIASNLDLNDNIQFRELMKYNPSDLSDVQYETLNQLVSKMYFNIYGSDMRENDFINTILNKGVYNRPYFSEKLIESSPSFYYEISNEMSVEEAVKNNIASFGMYSSVDREYFNKTFNLDNTLLNYKLGSNTNYAVQYINVKGSLDNHDVNIYVWLKDNKSSETLYMSLDEAIADKIIEPSYDSNENILITYYNIYRSITLEEFKENYIPNGDYQIYLPDGYQFDSKTMTVYSLSNEAKFIQSISEKSYGDGMSR